MYATKPTLGSGTGLVANHAYIVVSYDSANRTFRTTTPGDTTKPPMWYSAFPMLRDRYYVWADASKTNSPSATASARLPFRGPRWRRRSRHGSGGRAQGTASDPYASVSPWDQPRAATRTADWWRDALAARPDRPVPSITLATPRVRPPIAAAALDTIL